MENGSATDATDRSRVRSERQRTTVKKEPRSASKRERRRTGKQNLCARFVDLFIYPLFFNLPFFYDVVPRLRTRRSELCDSRESRSDETVKVQRTRESENFLRHLHNGRHPREQSVVGRYTLQDATIPRELVFRFIAPTSSTISFNSLASVDPSFRPPSRSCSMVKRYRTTFLQESFNFQCS